MPNTHFREVGLGQNRRIFLAEMSIEHALCMLIDYPSISIKMAYLLNGTFYEVEQATSNVTVKYLPYEEKDCCHTNIDLC